MVTLVVTAARPALADDPLSIVEGAGAPGFYDLLEDVAMGLGYFKEAHLDVSKQYAGNPSVAAALVATGKLNVASISAEPAITGYAKGLSLQYFFMRQVHYVYVLAVLADSPYHTVADLKGKQIGEPTNGNPVEVVAKSLLSEAGLSSNDYSFVPIGYAATNLAAVVARRVDAVSDTYSNLLTNEDQSNVQYRIFRDPILNDIANTGYCANPADIKARPDVYRRFARVLAKAAVFVHYNPAAAARFYLQASGQPVTDTLLAAQTKLITSLESEMPAADPSSRRIGFVSGNGLALESREMVTYGFAQQPVPAAAIATNQFMAYANDFDRNAIKAQALAIH
jgi:ABC-type nitrate/sulfonate/bicarbonate transport system substrate-binding protein